MTDHGPEPTKQQRQVLNELRNRLARLAALGTLDDADPGYETAQEPARSNAIGVLGPRGAGKSTVLWWLYQKWRNACGAHASPASGDLQGVYLLPTLDCSVLPADVEPATAALLHLYTGLTHDEKLKGRFQRRPAIEEDVDKLRELVERCTRMDRNYRGLCQDLAASPSDYSHYVVVGLEERVKLQKDLHVGLGTVLRGLGLRAFVVLLDDFDLVPAQEVRRWLLSLLDELRQPRLLFVLTGDFYRLEHLSWDAAAELDDKTGRSLLDKLLPAQNRVPLPGWTPSSRHGFRPTGSMGPTLWEQVEEKAIAKRPEAGGLVQGLLPERPRGLLNLYQTLAGAEGLEMSEFLHALATSRQEPLFARQLAETETEEWARRLSFAEDDLTVEDWRETVAAAAARPRPKPAVQLPPLRALGAVLDEDASSDTAMALGHMETVPSLLKGSEVTDPLRHAWLYRSPLRDAAEVDRPRWAELLIDLGLSLEPGPVRRDLLVSSSAALCVHLLTTWAPAARRLSRAQLRLKFGHRELCELFEDNPVLRDARAALCWLRSEAEGAIEIGWQPMIEALRGARDPLSSELLADLWVDPATLRGELPPAETAEALGLLPRRLWALILLVDGLDRCPWQALSMPRGWRIATYLGLAAALVRSAYVHALCACARLAEDALSPVQQSFFNALSKRDSGGLLGMSEEEVIQNISDLFADSLPGRSESGDDVLTEATAHYLASPVYKAAVTLIAAQRLPSP